MTHEYRRHLEIYDMLREKDRAENIFKFLTHSTKD